MKNARCFPSRAALQEMTAGAIAVAFKKSRSAGTGKIPPMPPERTNRKRPQGLILPEEKHLPSQSFFQSLNEWISSEMLAPRSARNLPVSFYQEEDLKKVSKSVLGAALAAATFVGFGGLTAFAQEIDLKGQTVTLIHNVAPGGATGIVATLAANAWSKTMAGNPTIVVQSVEGGAMSRGILQVMNSRSDGRTVGWVAWSGATRVLDPAKLQIPFRDFGLIGGVGAGHFFVHASTSVGGGISEKDEFVDKVDSFTFGGFAAKSASSMRTAAAFDMLGVPYKFVSGFGGNGPLLAAMQRGEIDGYPASSDAYIRNLRDEWIAQGTSLGLFYFSPPNAEGTGLSVDPSMPELEPFDSYYRRVKGEEPSGPLWEMIKFHGRISDRVNWLIVAPPGTPEEHLGMLRESFAKAMADPEFLAGAEKVFGVTPVIVPFPDIQNIVEEVAKTDQAILDTMNDYLKKMEQ